MVSLQLILNMGMSESMYVCKFQGWIQDGQNKSVFREFAREIFLPPPCKRYVFLRIRAKHEKFSGPLSNKSMGARARFFYIKL